MREMAPGVTADCAGADHRNTFIHDLVPSLTRPGHDMLIASCGKSSKPRLLFGALSVDCTNLAGLFGHRLALPWILRTTAAGSAAGQAAAQQPQFWTDQCRSGDHRQPRLCGARRRLYIDARIHDAEQRDQVYRGATGRGCVLAQRPQSRPADSGPVVALGPCLSPTGKIGGCDTLEFEGLVPQAEADRYRYFHSRLRHTGRKR